MTNKRNLIALIIVSIIAIVLGALIAPSFSIIATVVITLAALFLLICLYNLIKVIRAERQDRPVSERSKTRINWKNVVFVILIFIVIILLFRSCVDVFNFGFGDTDIDNSTNTDADTDRTDIHECAMPSTTGKSATCSEDGYIKTVCAICGKVFEETVIPATGDHTFDEGTVTKQPTETVKGEMTYTCTVCGTTKTEVIPTTDHVHKISRTETKDATCTSTGYVKYYCSCGYKVDARTLKKLDHDWKKVDGQYICRNCDAVKGSVEEETEHVHEVCETLNVPATCKEAGSYKEMCSCGHVMTSKVLPKKDHNLDEGKVLIPATETTAGIMTYTCKVCKEVVTEEIPVTGHVHKYIIETVKGTCTTSGYIVEKCSCGKQGNRFDTGMAEHQYVITDIVNATATTNGYKVYTCVNCNNSYKSTIPATGTPTQPDTTPDTNPGTQPTEVKLAVNRNLITDINQEIIVTVIGADMSTVVIQDPLEITEFNRTTGKITFKEMANGTIYVKEITSGKWIEITLMFD